MQTQNVDPAELAKFSDLAHRWWDPNSEFRPLHQINPLPIPYNCLVRKQSFWPTFTKNTQKHCF